MKPLILIGAGGHCRSVIDAAESAGLSIAGVLDRADSDVSDVLGYNVVGDDDMIPQLVPDCSFIVTVGYIKSPELRRKLHTLVKESRGELGKVIASTSRVSLHSHIGEGTVILHHATINAGARVGCGCIINSGANIEHDVRIGDGTHISTGCIINGNCIIGDEVFVGSGTVMSNGVKICSGAVIGAGSLVLHDITEPGVHYGII
ncbi:MAG: acetyltransferase [Prevotella sp.]|nr:acetyltransferase [Bacteroides sp.]MCM1366305.1 acetyltransferase [Prevotella sp.]MCM1437109.1 acetyltransferase [Prevotella sp.]